MLIIAGNEEFDQGNVPYEEAIKKAQANKIIVNTIFCGDYNRGVRFEWKDAAIRASGKYFNINHNDRRIYIATPYDDEIILLGKKLNKTYIYYGKNHKERMSNMMAQDANSKRISKSSYIERNLVKAKKQYSSAKWDMVDAYSKNAEAALNVSAETLPSELRGKDKKEMKKILEKKVNERTTIQSEINTLEKKRRAFISKKSIKKDDNLGDAIIKSIKKQAHENGFVFSK